MNRNDYGHIRGVLFDAAGTIIRLTSPVGEIYAGWAREAGVTTSAEELQRSFKTALAAMTAKRWAVLARGRDRGTEEAWWQQVVHLSFILAGSTPPVIPFRPLYDSFAAKGRWALYDDVMTTLGELSGKNIFLGILSNFDERLEQILDHLGVAHFFRTMIISSRIGYPKPHPSIFKAGADALGLSPAEILYIGDSYAEDYLGAKQAGMGVVLIDRLSRYGIRESLPSLTGLTDLLLLEGKQYSDDVDRDC